jgi:hypothetical protein
MTCVEVKLIIRNDEFLYFAHYHIFKKEHTLQERELFGIRSRERTQVHFEFDGNNYVYSQPMATLSPLTIQINMPSFRICFLRH